MAVHRNAAVLWLPLMLAAPLLLCRTAGATADTFTIQIRAFQDLISAGAQFNGLYKTLPEQQKRHLRIEFNGNEFLLKIGRFPSEKDAGNVLRIVKRTAPAARVMQYTPDEESVNRVLIEFIPDTKSPPKGNMRKEKPAEQLNREALSAQERSSIPETADDLAHDVSVHFFGGEYEKATELIRKGLRRWPNRHDLHAWHGAALLDSGDAEGAYEAYLRAAELAPREPEYHAGVGFSLMGIYYERAKRSIDAFQHALAIDSTNASALEGLGIAYVSIGRKDLAAGPRDRLVEIDRDAAARLDEYISFGIDWSRD